MSIIPTKPAPSTGSSGDSTLLSQMPVREVFVKNTDNILMGTGMLMLSDNSLLAPEGFGVQSGSIDFGDLITLSESSGFLALTNNLDGKPYRVVDHYVPRNAPSSTPGFIQMIEAENSFIPQPDYSTVLTSNPLTFNYTTQLLSRVNSLTFKASSAMTNVRIKITKVDVNVVEKYYPNKSNWVQNTGVAFTSGDNVIDFGDSPLLFSPGTQLSYEVRADNVSLLGSASGTPYLSGMVQRGVFTYLATESEVIPSAIKAGLEGLSSPNKLSKNAIQDGVTSVNSQFGDVVISSDSINAQPVNTNLTNLAGLTPTAGKIVGTDDSGNYSLFTLSPLSKSVLASNSGTFIQSLLGVVSPVNADWNSASGLSQVLNKPVLSTVATSGSYNDLSNKPVIPTVNYPVTSVNSKTGAVVLSAADVGAIATGSSIPYSSLTGAPTIPAAQVNSDWNASSGVAQILNKPTIPAAVTKTSQLTNDSGFVTSVTFPVTSVNTKTGAVVLSNVDVGAAATVHTHVIGDVTGLQTALDSKITAGASIPYSTITGTPSIPTNSLFTFRGLSDTDDVAIANGYLLWNSGGTSVSYSTTIPFTALSGKPTTLSGYGITDGVSSASLVTTLNGYATTTALTSGLSAKFNTPTGATTQYVRGDGSLATTPVVPTVVSAFTNDSLYINQAGARTAISLTTTGNGAATYNNTTGVINVPTPTLIQATATRALNTIFQVSSTRNALVVYSVQMTVTATITSGQNGDIILEIASDSGFTTNVQTVSIAGLSQVYTLAVAIQGVQGQTNTISGVIPAGYYARLRTVNTTGTPTFSYRAGQETLM